MRHYVCWQHVVCAILIIQPAPKTSRGEQRGRQIESECAAMNLKSRLTRQTRDAAINVQFSQNYKNVSKHFICAFNFVASCLACLVLLPQPSWHKSLAAFFYSHFVLSVSLPWLFFSRFLSLSLCSACCSDKNLNNSPNVPS